MFSVQCPQHGGEVLLPERRIESLRNTMSGIEVRWVCYCGHRGSFMTGRLRDPPAQPRGPFFHAYVYRSVDVCMEFRSITRRCRRGGCR